MFEAVMTSGVVRDWMDELETVVHAGLTIKVLSGSAIFTRHGTFYSNDGSVFLRMPDNRVSTIILRRDQKEGIVNIQVLRDGWRRFFERIFCLHRYYDMPLADVEYRDGEVVRLEDRRQFVEYFVAPKEDVPREKSKQIVC
jgi:hypothetical protein